MYNLRRILIYLLVLMLNAIGISAANAQPHLTEDEAEYLRVSISLESDSGQKLSSIDYLAQNMVDLDSMAAYTISELNLATALGDSLYIMKSLDRLGWYYATSGKFDKSLEFYARLLKVNEQCGDMVGYAKALSGMGDALLGMRNFERGIELKKRAFNLLADYGQDMERAIILRSIGKTCIDYMQYSMAMENFQEALAIDLSLPAKYMASRSIGRDYHFIGRTIHEGCLFSDTAALNEAKNYLLKGMEYHTATEDYIYEVHGCMTISVIYANMVSITRNWNFADSSLYYYNLGREIAAKSGYKRHSDYFEIIHAQHQALLGYRREALDILQKYNKPDSHQDIQMALTRAYFFIYWNEKNWKGLFENFQRAEHVRKKMYITEFFSKVSKINVISDMENVIYRNERQFINDSNRYKREDRFHKAFTGYASVLIFIFLLLLLALGVLYIYNKVLNQRLVYHDTRMRQVNDELQALYNENKEQSEEIAAQTLEMKRQRNELSTYNFKMMVHLGIGQRMQSCIMPSAETVRSVVGDSFIIWRPLEEVSGDFYWCSDINGYKIIAVADCTGHGIPGAFLSMLGVALLNSIVPRMGHNTTAAKILDRLRERLVELMMRGAGQSGVHDGMDIALCMFDERRHRLMYAGAYRPLWMVRKGVLTEYKGDKYPVAVDNDRQGSYTNYEIETRSGDMFYMFSDGITDQYGMDGKGKLSKFKPKRLREFVEKYYKLDTKTQCAELETTMDLWRGMEEQTDDILVIGIMER